MATILRDLSYRYQWLYDSISRLSALTIGGEKRFRQLPLENLKIDQQTKILDLCCGSGQATGFLVQYSDHVTGLDASSLSLTRAKRNVPEAKYVESWAENMPFSPGEFDLVHTSAALHEMSELQLQQILAEVYRVLKPGGIFTLADFHQPTNMAFWPAIALFFWLFETETCWQFIQQDLKKLLTDVGFTIIRSNYYAGGSLQVIQAEKSIN